MPSMKIPHNKVTYPEELVWPIGSQDLRFIRTTDRYDDKGTISNNATDKADALPISRLKKAERYIK